MKTRKLHDGYEYVNLTKNNVVKTFSIHRLVALTFLIKNELKKEVNHINYIKTDNKLINLEWCTREENMNHAFKTGFLKNKLTIENVLYIKKNYKPNDKKFSGSSLAKKFGVSQGRVSDIINNKTYKYVII